MGPEDASAVADRYARFARDEAPARSALYAEWARGVAGDPRTAAILARIPETRRQPPLVFAVTRLLGAPEAAYPAWATWVHEHADELVVEASRRRLQTNEPQRCAALLPALAAIDGPLALLEVGASAGLCLYPDRYSYRFVRDDGTVTVLDPADGASTVTLACSVTGEPPLRMPEVVWRAGIDLEPLDAGDADDRRFLISLVWPGEEGRAARIEAALDIVAAAPPQLIAGDASDPEVLRAAAALAPAGATLVVTTPGVLPHVPRAGRERLVGTLQTLGAVWVTIDPTRLHGWRPFTEAPADDGFVLARDGVPLAAVDPLGGFVRWRAPLPEGMDASG